MCMRNRKCPNCKQFFTPHPATRHHQRYCCRRVCQQVRKAVSNRRFRRANPGYDRGSHNVDRVREWRRDNPGYWRHEKRNGGPGRTGVPALQAVPKPQPIEHQVINLKERVDTLQAVSDRQGVLFQGLAAQLSGSALQADLVPVLDTWYDKGRQLAGLPAGAPSLTGITEEIR